MFPAWAASFISADSSSQEDGPAPYFRRDFTVSDGLRRATLHITALGIVEPYLNGTRVGDEVLEPGWTSYQHRLMIRAHDVAELLIPGENTLGAIVGEGWAAGELGWDGKRNLYSDRPALFARLELEYGDRTEVIGTDEAFRVGSGAVLRNGIYTGETYDARLEPRGWNRPGFDDSMWSRASLFAWDPATLQAPGAPPIRRIEELEPAEILTTPAGRTVVDFGQNLSGWVHITVEGPCGTTVTLRHAELLTPAGEPDYETNRTASATDTYVLSGHGRETWEPRFTFHGFRYVDIEGWPGQLTPQQIRAVVVHTDMVRTGWFESSNDLVNRLHQNAVWSMRGNFVGVPTDCPQRDERLGWTGDLNAFAPTAVYLYDVKDMLGSWLQDLGAEQASTGQVPVVVPDVLRAGAPPTALWGDVAISLPWLLHQEYDDDGLLRSSYDSMKMFMSQVEKNLDEDGLWSTGFQYGDWLDPDAPADSPWAGKTDPHLVASAYLCKTSRELAQSAQVLGEDADAERYARLAERSREAFRREYVTPAGRISGESATAYALAIMFGILGDDQRTKAGGRLAALVRESGYVIATGFAGTPLIADALSSTGHLDDAYRLLLQTKAPSFLYPVTMGATTIWERWDAVLPDGTLNSTGMTSLNHYALGAVADWLHRVVGGLQRLEPGWRRIRIAPKPGGGFTHARVSHHTPRGRVDVHWAIDGTGTMKVFVTVPAGTEAEVELPKHPDSLTLVVGPGEHSWEYLAESSTVGLTLDSRIDDVRRDDTVWPAVIGVLRAHFPGVPMEAAIEHMGHLTLAQTTEHNPDTAEDMRQELLAALAHHPR